MADIRLITSYPGDATPKDIVLRPLPVADVTTTDIYLWAGDASPKDIVLRDPTTYTVTGGATSIDCTVGNTAATGTTASITLTTNTVIACGVGNASAAGVTSGYTVSMPCSVGNAAANGITAGFKTSVNCNIYSASATGITAGFAVSMPCSVGNASANGITSGFAVSLPASVGNASATGITASLSLSSNTVIDCSVGNATATGVTNGFIESVSTSVGNASATGVNAGFTDSLNAGVGNASAEGITGAIALSGATEIGCSVGNASAEGIAASIGISGAVDTRLDQILAILTGLKVYDSETGLWRVYDSNGVEIADPSGILMRGLHGFLLRQYSGAAAGYETKKKYVARVGDRLMVFRNEADALNALPKPEVKVKQYPKKKKQKVVAVKETYVAPETTVDLSEIARYAAIYDLHKQYQAMLNQKRYEALITLYEFWRDEEEVELLLMAA